MYNRLKEAVLQSDLVANSAVLTGNVDTQLQDVVNNIPNTFPGASATYFDFGASLGAVYHRHLSSNCAHL